MGLLSAGGGGLLQGALGFFAARAKKKQIEKMEEANQRRNVLEQAWAGTYGQKEKLPEMMDKPSPVLAGLQGALAGGMQGLNVYQGMQNQDFKDRYLKMLEGNPAKAPVMSPEEFAQQLEKTNPTIMPARYTGDIFGSIG